MTKWKPKQKKTPWTRMRGGIKPRGWNINSWAKQLTKTKAASAKRLNDPKKSSHKPIRRVSPARAKQLREYRARVKVWIVGKMCECRWDFTCQNRVHSATDCHHQKGRIGKLLLDERFWMPVCRTAHDWIRDNRADAMARGWILPNWNSTPRTKHQRR